MTSRSWLTILAALVLLAAIGCAGDDDDASGDDAPGADDDSAGDDDDNDDDDNDDTAPGRAEIVVPPYPFWPNDAFRVDEGHIEDLATAYCADPDVDAPASADFFFGWLPLRSFDLFFDDDAPAADVLLGNLYLSGYFGGVWLAEALQGELPKGRAPDILRVVFQALAAMTLRQTEAAAHGDDAAVLDAAHTHIFPLLAIYAYNRGYLEQIIANPPPGVAPLEGWLVCGERGLLDCTSDLVGFAFLDRSDAALDALADPPTDRWAQMAALVTHAEPLVDKGAAVWEVIDISLLSETDYRLLVKLSLDFLLASKVSVLGNMTAWADRLAAEGRRTLLVDSGMMLWSGAYFMGLMGGSGDALPELVCP
jgi:hypothetical protein